MITVIRIELAPDERRALASMIDGKPTRRLATREEIKRWAGRATAKDVEGLTATYYRNRKPPKEERASNQELPKVARWKTSECACPNGPGQQVERTGNWCDCGTLGTHIHCMTCHGRVE